MRPGRGWIQSNLTYQSRGSPSSGFKSFSPDLLISQILVLYLYYNQKINIMYSLDCNYYENNFSTIDELIRDVIQSGMDPNYEITKDGRGTGEQAIDLIQF